MKVTILGCGGAGGVPMISHGWGDCDPGNPRNRRRRSSILVEQGETRLLVDTTPDLRDQAIEAGIRRLDAVLYTHGHADHTHGIDDLREINRAMGGPLDVYGDKGTLDGLVSRFAYVFESLDTTQYPIYKPMLVPRLIEGAFQVGEVAVTPFEQDHGYGRSLGFRFGPVAYSTDVVELPAEAFEILHKVPVWIVGCLTWNPHQTHAHVDKVLDWVDRIRPGLTLLTHMSIRLDYDDLCRKLPAHVRPAHDGLVIEA